METRLWNLILRAASILAGVSLLLSIALVGASQLGYTENHAAGMVTLVFAAALAIASIVLVNLAHSRQAAEITAATDAAHRMAQGERFEERAETELMGSLRAISDYMSEKASHMQRIAAGDLSENVAVR